MRNPDRKLDDVLLGLALIVAAVAASRFVDYAYDDAYITYRYARNLATGHGFVYNLGDLYLGTTTPLYTLLLAALHPILDIPVGTAKSRQYRGLAAMRSSMSAEPEAERLPVAERVT